MKNYTVWCDGACPNNGKQGARSSYGIVFNYGTPDEACLNGVIEGEQHTNNRAELLAFIKAMECFIGIEPQDANITVYTDSNYLVQGYNQWLKGWVAKGYRTSQNEQIANRDLWEVIERYKMQYSPVVVHVRGHAGNEGNELADKLANMALAGNFVDTISKGDFKELEPDYKALLKDVLAMLHEASIVDDIVTIREYIELKLN